jgi:hypothetical protein
MNSNIQQKQHNWVVSVPDWSKYILLVKVGSDCRPAASDDIQDVKKAIEAAFSDPAKPKTVGIVTHHAIQVELLQVRP